jgi:hypothetical protein
MAFRNQRGAVPRIRAHRHSAVSRRELEDFRSVNYYQGRLLPRRHQDYASGARRQARALAFATKPTEWPRRILAETRRHKFGKAVGRDVQNQARNTCRAYFRCGSTPSRLEMEMTNELSHMTNNASERQLVIDILNELYQAEHCDLQHRILLC